MAGDGSAYVTGLSDSFTVDAFGQPRAAIFAVKFAAGGSLAWQRVWNGPTVFGSFGVPETALAPDGSVYVAGTTTLGSNKGVVLKVNPDGTLAYARAWQSGSTAAGVAVAPRRHHPARGDRSVAPLRLREHFKSDIGG
jgi:hypothetical protein